MHTVRLRRHFLNIYLVNSTIFIPNLLLEFSVLSEERSQPFWMPFSLRLGMKNVRGEHARFPFFFLIILHELQRIK